MSIDKRISIPKNPKETSNECELRWNTIGTYNIEHFGTAGEYVLQGKEKCRPGNVRGKGASRYGGETREQCKARWQEIINKNDEYGHSNIAAITSYSRCNNLPE